MALHITGLLLVPMMLLLGGCSGPFEVEGPYMPTGARTAWSQTDAKPWIGGTKGCGFCSGDANVSEIDTVVVYDSGEVLWFAFGASSRRGDGPSSLELAAGLEAYRDELAELKATLRNAYVDGRDIKVHHVRTGQLGDLDWQRIGPYFEAAVSEATDPGAPVYACQDCGAYHAELLTGKRLYATLHGNYEEGDPWDRIMTQLGLVEDWVASD